MSKKLLAISWLAVSLLVAGCGGVSAFSGEQLATQQVSESAIQWTPTVGELATFEPTATVTPDVEVSVLQTQIVDLQAQFVQLQNSNEQNRQAILAQIADNEQQRQFEATQIAVIATMTALPIELEMARVNQEMAGMAATQVIEAPTVTEVARVADYKERYGNRDALLTFGVQYGGIFALLVLTIALFMALRRPLKKSIEAVSPIPLMPEREAFSDERSALGSAFTLEVEQVVDSFKSADFYHIPCSREDFTKVVDAILSGWTWGYKKWQTRGAPVEFKVFRKLRQFALVNKWIMVVPNSDGRVMNTALGDRIFNAWRDGQAGNLEFSEGAL